MRTFFVPLEKKFSGSHQNVGNKPNEIHAIYPLLQKGALYIGFDRSFLAPSQQKKLPSCVKIEQ